MQFDVAQTRSGCINRQQERIDVRRSGVFDRPQFGEVKRAVKLMAQGALGRLQNDCIRGQGRTVLWQKCALRISRSMPRTAIANYVWFTPLNTVEGLHIQSRRTEFAMLIQVLTSVLDSK